MIPQKLIKFQLNIPGFYRVAFNLGINYKIKEFTSKGKDSSELCELLFNSKQLSATEQADSHMYGSMVCTETCGLLDTQFNELLDEVK